MGRNSVRIKSSRERGGGVEDVRFDNWTMENVGTAINVTNYYLMEGEVRNPNAVVNSEDAGNPQHRHQQYDGEPASARGRGH